MTRDGAGPHQTKGSAAGRPGSRRLMKQKADSDFLPWATTAYWSSTPFGTAKFVKDDDTRRPALRFSQR